MFVAGTNSFWYYTEPYHRCTSAIIGAKKIHAVKMAKMNSSSSGCRVMIMAGKYLSGPGPSALNGSGPRRQQDSAGAPRRQISSDAAGTRGKAASTAQEQLGLYSATDRHLAANRNLIYRDVKAFLGEVGGDPREARYWLTQFQKASSSQSPAFAVLEVKINIFIF